jgi:hypothetical protein
MKLIIGVLAEQDARASRSMHAFDSRSPGEQRGVRRYERIGQTENCPRLEVSDGDRIALRRAPQDKRE